jgi:hypothetical protein
LKKILIGGAGGAPSEGVIKSLKHWPRREKILGMGSSKIDLTLSKADYKYLMENADQTVTTRDLGRVIRPPKAKDGEAPHMIKWLRSLPFVDILGHSEFGGNIVKLRTPGANWYMLDSKQHIAGPYTLADIKKQCAGAPKKIRHGNSGKFQMSTEFAMTA